MQFEKLNTLNRLHFVSDKNFSELYNIDHRLFEKNYPCLSQVILFDMVQSVRSYFGVNLIHFCLMSSTYTLISYKTSTPAVDLRQLKVEVAD